MSDIVNDKATAPKRRYEILRYLNVGQRIVIEAASAEEAEQRIDDGDWHDSNITDTEEHQSEVLEANELPPEPEPPTPVGQDDLIEEPSSTLSKPTNHLRACWADLAIREFMEATRADPEDALCDLLADLMHWADRTGFDFGEELESAREHYQAESLAESQNGEPTGGAA